MMTICALLPDINLIGTQMLRNLAKSEQMYLSKCHFNDKKYDFHSSCFTR